MADLDSKPISGRSKVNICFTSLSLSLSLSLLTTNFNESRLQNEYFCVFALKVLTCLLVSLSLSLSLSLSSTFYLIYFACSFLCTLNLFLFLFALHSCTSCLFIVCLHSAYAEFDCGLCARNQIKMAAQHPKRHRPLHPCQTSRPPSRTLDRFLIEMRTTINCPAPSSVPEVPGRQPTLAGILCTI
jgi:predicted RNA-binding Zn-ribbon protein involved in translation (DUF1610 family)